MLNYRQSPFCTTINFIKYLDFPFAFWRIYHTVELKYLEILEMENFATASYFASYLEKKLSVILLVATALSTSA